MTANKEYIPEDMFEEDSLTYILGYTAHKFKSKHQDLEGNGDTNECRAVARHWQEGICNGRQFLYLYIY